MRPKLSIALEAPAEAALVAPMELATIPALAGTNARYQELGPGSSSDEAVEAMDRLLQLHVHIVNLTLRAFRLALPTQEIAVRW